MAAGKERSFSDSLPSANNFYLISVICSQHNKLQTELTIIQLYAEKLDINRQLVDFAPNKLAL